MGGIHPFRNRRRWSISAGEWRLMILSGVALGLVGQMALERWRGPVMGDTPVISATSTAGAVRFGLCADGGGANCVIDGDTFRMGGEKIRIADIDTPETHPPRCPAEAALGGQATRRLHTLLNAGPFTLEPIARDVDRYGRKLRIVTRDGESLGETLVSEGLARRYGGGPRAGWC